MKGKNKIFLILLSLSYFVLNGKMDEIDAFLHMRWTRKECSKSCVRGSSRFLFGYSIGLIEIVKNIRLLEEVRKEAFELLKEKYNEFGVKNYPYVSVAWEEIIKNEQEKA